MRYCFFNGEVMPQTEAKVSVTDIGLLRAYGIYEGITAVNGTPFKFADHWQRLVDSAHALSLNIPITEEKCERVIRELISMNSKEPGSEELSNRCNIRVILTGGAAVGGIEFNFETPTFYMLIEDFSNGKSELYEKGAKLSTYHFKRQLPNYKTVNYITAVNLQDWRKEEGAVEILYTYDGEVLECSTSNIFIVKDGVISTPAEGILDGITRKAVMELVEVEERAVMEDELHEADEVFITSSFKDVVPIVTIDDYTVADGKPGPITQDLISRFAKELNS